MKGLYNAERYQAHRTEAQKRWLRSLQQKRSRRKQQDSREIREIREICDTHNPQPAASHPAIQKLPVGVLPEDTGQAPACISISETAQQLRADNASLRPTQGAPPPLNEQSASGRSRGAKPKRVAWTPLSPRLMIAGQLKPISLLAPGNATVVREPADSESESPHHPKKSQQELPQAETDESLLTRLQAKDPEALAQLWERYSGLLFTQALGVLHNPAEAEDVVIEVFAEVWRRAANYHPERARPAAWLVTLVRRRSIDRLRERRSYEKAGVRLAVECESENLSVHFGAHESGSEGVEEQVYLSELRHLLEQALNGLPEHQKETVSLVYFHGLTQKEIAVRTSTPLGTVKTRLELGLRKMRERIRCARVRSAMTLRGP